MMAIFTHHSLGWVGAMLVLYGYYLNANMDEHCWPIWILGNVMVALYCMEKRAYPTAAMSFILVIINIYGYVRWLDF